MSIFISLPAVPAVIIAWTFSHGKVAKVGAAMITAEGRSSGGVVLAADRLPFNFKDFVFFQFPWIPVICERFE
jgi:hypothetical protein